MSQKCLHRANGLGGVEEGWTEHSRWGESKTTTAGLSEIRGSGGRYAQDGLGFS